MPKKPSDPIPPSLTVRDLAKQFWRDIYGKEVQSAATYSYTWVADQTGHICLGILLSFGFTAIVDQILPPGTFWSPFLGFLLASSVVSYWEYRAYNTDVKKAVGGLFPLGEKLLRDNAIIAAVYMILGAGVGWAFHNSVIWATAGFAALAVVAVVLAPPWLRQKITWQKGGMPYLARLADIKVKVPKPLADKLWQVIQAGAPPEVPPQVAVIGGPVGSGRTSIACGIGTEFAFRNISVRYLSFDDLTEFAETSDFEIGEPVPGPANIGFWPWSCAQVLIIDNLGPLLAASERVQPAGHIGDLSAWLAHRLPNIRDALSKRHTIWILGEVGAKSQDELDGSAAAIGKFLGADANPLAILMNTRADAVTADEVTRSEPALVA